MSRFNYKRSSKARIRQSIVLIVLFAGIFCTFLVPCGLSFYNEVLTRLGDKAFAEGNYDEARSQYQSALNAPMCEDIVLTKEKIAVTDLALKDWVVAEKETKELLLIHLARLDEITSDAARFRKEGVAMLFYETQKVSYLLSNYVQNLALQNRLDEIKPYQTTIWQQVFEKTSRVGMSSRIKKILLDCIASSLYQRGYTGQSEIMATVNANTQSLPPVQREATQTEQLFNLMPPKPYDRPNFSHNAMYSNKGNVLYD